MKKVLISAALAVLLVILITGFAWAALPDSEASGSFVTGSTTIHRIMEDKFNETIELSSSVTYLGAMEGTSILQGTLTVRPDDSTTFVGSEIFTGSVNGIPGTLTFKVAGSSEPYQAIQLTNTITSGTGGLARLHGAISMRFIRTDNGPAGLYTSQIDLE